MSQRRTRKQRLAPPIEVTKKEKIQAILGVAAVVGFTTLCIWAVRPGAPDYYGLTGGIASRQPKATILVIGSLLAIGISIVMFRKWAADGRGPKRQPWLGVSHLVIVAVALAAGFFWPGGLLRHRPGTETPNIPDITVPPLTNSTVPEVSATTVPGESATTTPIESVTTAPADVDGPDADPSATTVPSESG